MLKKILKRKPPQPAARPKAPAKPKAAPTKKTATTAKKVEKKAERVQTAEGWLRMMRRQLNKTK